MRVYLYLFAPFFPYAFTTRSHISSTYYTHQAFQLYYIYWSHKTVGKSTSQLFSIISYLFLLIELSHYKRTRITISRIFFPLCLASFALTISFVHRACITYFCITFYIPKILYIRWSSSSIKIINFIAFFSEGFSFVQFTYILSSFRRLSRILRCVGFLYLLRTYSLRNKNWDQNWRFIIPFLRTKLE